MISRLKLAETELLFKFSHNSFRGEIAYAVQLSIKQTLRPSVKHTSSAKRHLQHFHLLIKNSHLHSVYNGSTISHLHERGDADDLAQKIRIEAKNTKHHRIY